MRFIQQHARILIFLVLSVYLFKAAVNDSDLVAAGDGMEYVLMTEALYNHGTPDVRLTDIRKYRHESEKYGDWKAQINHGFIDDLYAQIHAGKANYRDNLYGFAKSKNGQYVSIHFFTYPLFILPIKYVLRPFHIHPIKVFFIANALFIFAVLYVVFFFFPFKEWINISIGLFYYFSTINWYFLWVHPEIMVCSLIFLSLFIFQYSNKPYLALFLGAIAATQYQPLTILIFIMAIHTVWKNKFQWKSLIRVGLATCMVLAPAVYYYSHFEVTNMVKYLGFLDTKYITSTRIIGFFTDLNQGLIISFPLLFIVYLLLLILDWYTRIKRKAIQFHIYDLIPVLLIGLLMILTTMGNWNHGQSINNRYVTYIGTLMLCHFLILSLRWIHVRSILIILALTLVTQVVTIQYFGGPKAKYWTEGKHKKLAEKVLNRYPQFYNPDPWIFMARTAGFQHESYYYKGVVYRDVNQTFKKAIIHKEHLDQVSITELADVKLDELVADKNDQYGWVYIDYMDLPNAVDKN